MKKFKLAPDTDRQLYTQNRRLFEQQIGFYLEGACQDAIA